MTSFLEKLAQPVRILKKQFFFSRWRSTFRRIVQQEFKFGVDGDDVFIGERRCSSRRREADAERRTRLVDRQLGRREWYQRRRRKGKRQRRRRNGAAGRKRLKWTASRTNPFGKFEYVMKRKIIFETLLKRPNWWYFSPRWQLSRFLFLSSFSFVKKKKFKVGKRNIFGCSQQFGRTNVEKKFLEV